MTIFDYKICKTDKDFAYNMADCSSCGKSFRIDQLECEWEYESWEMPEQYIVHICPVCEDGGCVESYWYSRKTAFFQWIRNFLGAK